MRYNESDLSSALEEILSIIKRCEKAQVKFEVGTAQYSLLTNRINAMRIAKELIFNEMNRDNVLEHYSLKDLENAEAPIESIIHKCSKSIENKDNNPSYYNRVNRTIQTMELSKQLLVIAIQNME